MANPFTGGAAAFSPIDYLAPDIAESQRQLARQQAVADLLRQRALEDDSQTQIVSGWAIPQSGFKPVEKLANALLAGKMQQGLDEKQAAIAKRYAEALTGGSATGAATTAAGATTGTAAGTPSLRQIMTYNLLGIPIPPKVAERMMGVEPNKEIVKVDTGNAVSVYAVDPVTGGQTLVQTLPKGVSPDTTATVTSREGQGELDRQVTTRGQDMSARTAAAGQAIDARTAGANGGFAGTGMDPQAMNAYSTLSLKAQSQTLTPQEQLQLDLAIRHLTQPRIGGTAETGFYEIPAQPLPTLGAPSSVNAPAAAPPTAPVVAPPSAPAATPPAAPQAGAMPRVLTAPNRQPTQDQSKAAGFTSRMENAENIFTKFPDAAGTLQTQAMGGVPLVGDALKRSAQTDAQQQYQQAQEDWVRAKLRKESGAVIGPDEMRDEVRTYFPQPGDKPDVIRQKAQARAIAAEALRKEAGPAYYKSSVVGSDEPARRINWSELPE